MYEGIYMITAKEVLALYDKDDLESDEYIRDYLEPLILEAAPTAKKIELGMGVAGGSLHFDDIARWYEEGEKRTKLIIEKLEATGYTLWKYHQYPFYTTDKYFLVISWDDTVSVEDLGNGHLGLTQDGEYLGEVFKAYEKDEEVDD